MAPESLSDGHFSEKSDVVNIILTLQSHNSLIHFSIYYYYNTAVVLWCDGVGDIQWRKGTLSWSGPPHTHAAAGVWGENEQT